MDKGQRIKVIQRVRDALSEMSRDDEDLILSTYGLGERPVYDFSGEGPSLTEWLNGADDEQLLVLAQYLEVQDNTAAPVSSLSESAAPEPLFLFATHLSTHRAFLGEVETDLARYGVRMFVAHDSIPMDAPWEKEIVDAQAGAVFIHSGLHQSFYCMQEAGWMLGRGIPIARLMFGEFPKGLLGAHQGRPLLNRPGTEVAAALMDWALTHPSLAPHVAESLTVALDNSTGYRVTDMVWARLTTLVALNHEQIRRVVHAAETNSQVYGTGLGGYGGRAYRHLIVACHEHGTALSGSLPTSWDHLDCQSWDHPARLFGGSSMSSLTVRVMSVDAEVVSGGIQGGQRG